MKYVQSFSFWSIMFSFLSVFGYLFYFFVGVPSCRNYEHLNIPVFIEGLWYFIVAFCSISYLLAVLLFVLSLILKRFKKNEVGRVLAGISLILVFLFRFSDTLYMNTAVYDCGRLEGFWRIFT